MIKVAGSGLDTYLYEKPLSGVLLEDLTFIPLLVYFWFTIESFLVSLSSISSFSSSETSHDSGPLEVLSIAISFL
jgi:hypothetical protein